MVSFPIDIEKCFTDIRNVLITHEKPKIPPAVVNYRCAWYICNSKSSFQPLFHYSLSKKFNFHSL